MYSIPFMSFSFTPSLVLDLSCRGVVTGRMVPLVTSAAHIRRYSQRSLLQSSSLFRRTTIQISTLLQILRCPIDPLTGVVFSEDEITRNLFTLLSLQFAIHAPAHFIYVGKETENSDSQGS
jgi:hypothetical protein